MKKTLSTAAAAGLALLILSGCSTPSAAAGYTGTAVVQETYQGSRKHGCELLVKMNKRTEQAWVRVGRRTTCEGYQHGTVVSLKDGILQK